MSEQDLLPETSYTAEGKERVALWKEDLLHLANDAGKCTQPVAAVCRSRVVGVPD